MSSISDLAATLRQVASPGINPKELVAVVREKHPDATKKEIVRAAFFALSDGSDTNHEQTGELYDFALKERGAEDQVAVRIPKRKRDRKAPDSQSRTA